MIMQSESACNGETPFTKKNVPAPGRNQAVTPFILPMERRGNNPPHGTRWPIFFFPASITAVKILVIGSGGREHALVWKLAQSPRVSQMWCAPGNAGIAAETLSSNGALVSCLDLAADNSPALLAFANEKRVDLTVVGPDNPLALGVVDLFQQNGLRIWGPNQRAAQFESSKAFSQAFMEKYNIPTARSKIFSDAAAAKSFAAELGGRCAVKADGLALGKGVLLCHSGADASQAVDDMLIHQKFGAAGRQIVVQELLEGMEISLHALCDGRTSRLFPTAQDHKRIGENDTGPNTGGMGAYSPTPFLDEAGLEQVADRILTPWEKGCRAEGIDFRGILYPGVMLTEQGPKVLEFNARFGDPEAQAYLMAMNKDLLDLLEASMEGALGKFSANFVAKHFRGVAVCVVMASAGYPASSRKGDIIHGLEEAGRLPQTKIFHAGTARAGGNFVTHGGRVLGVTAWGATLAEARARAYLAVGKIQFDGAQFRRDIGAKALRAAQP
jgi:phosphoribosylamine---glycine ligase